ncbi:hypothetical protein Tco_1041996 [Tanacetum coccineum]|uniref:Uncharacterized protein n=1 Tax=Tanacetum coccineum TaxID=301880 RepID=A0ABQ5GHR5_9ASTR
MMMPHGGELLARYRRLNQSHHKYVLSTDSRLKGYEEMVASFTGLELQVSALKKQVSGLSDKLSSTDASFAKSKAKGKDRKKKIKSLTKSVDNLHSEVACLFAALNQATVLKTEKDEEILRRVQGELLSIAASAGFEYGLSMHRTKDEFLEPEKLVRLVNVPTLREVRVSPPTKESTMTPASKSLELSTNVNFTASTIASEHNEEMGISIALDDDMEFVEVCLGPIFSVPNDVVVALSALEKGDGLDPSFAASEEAAANPFGVM